MTISARPVRLAARAMVAVCLVGGAALAGTGVAAATAATGAATGCGGGKVISETMSAPSSVRAGTTFSVHVQLRNCTGSAQSFNLEGFLHPPAPCTAPVIDPLPVTIAAHHTFATRYDLPATSCTGTYSVQVEAVQNSTVLATHTAHVSIT